MGHEMPSYLNANVLIIIVNIQDEAGSVSVSQLNQYGHWLGYPMPLLIVRLVLICKAMEICLIFCKHPPSATSLRRGTTMGNGIGYHIMCEDYFLSHLQCKQ